jgi:mono/diheme cytochrome c family protein
MPLLIMHITLANARVRNALRLALALIAGMPLASLAFPAAKAPGGPPVDFNRDLRPVLVRNCFACHGPDEEARKGKLRLDLRDQAVRPDKSGATPVIPGDPGHSELIRRITTPDEDDRMPPLKTGKTLTPSETDLFRRWIAQGAVWKKHWAYEKPVAAPRPKIRRASWPKNPLDFYVLARLEKEGLRPSPEASRETLIRRVSLDLTGLPPSPDEVRAFLSDKRPGAYERLVDRLLASPHYGERWARFWLDLARYADSNGYEKDGLRTAWPYRDWVINAFNRDLPFEEFTIEQIAGDLLPNATRGQRVATGFHRNTMVNTEGGTDDEEFRIAAVVDRVNTTYNVWLGTTMGCAQCHTHKYDPFTQKEYYQSMAFFNQTKDRGKSTEPELDLPAPEQSAKHEEVRAKIVPLQKLLDTQTPEIQAREDAWREKMLEANRTIQSQWIVLEPGELKGLNGVLLEKLPDNSVLSKGSLPDHTTYEVGVVLPEGTFSALRLEALVDESLPNKSCGRSEEGDFVVTDFSVDPPPVVGEKPVKFTRAYADYSMDGYDAAAAIDDNPQSGWSIAAYEQKNRANHQAVFVWSQAWTAKEGQRLTVRIRQDSNRARHLLGRFRLSASRAGLEPHKTWAKLPAATRGALAERDGKSEGKQKDELAKYFRSIDPELDATRRQIAALRKEEPKGIPTTLVMEAVDEPRETHVLIRGNFLSPGGLVQPGVPEALPPLPAGPTNRLTFARWLVSPENPLTARVTMNRIWAQYFGRGIVETSDDFGMQGEPPSQPEALDWLAVEFIRQGWSLKAMHRLIVTSATYRQDSKAGQDLVLRDPYNRLLARGPRFRLDAEMIRDNALAASGLLDPKIGGPSVYPYQPDGIWSRPYSGETWETSKNGDQFRRGLYTFWRRTSPYPSFMAFDASSREVVCERRARSDTPVQALVTLNDPAFLAAAGGLARRVQSEGSGDPASRLDFAYRCVLGRAPRKPETAVLLKLYDQSLKRYSADRKAAEAIVSVGLPAPGPEADLPSLAAWTVVSNVLLNLDETLTKG